MPDYSNLTILQINDTHGYFELHNEIFWSGRRALYRKAGGYARIATLCNEVREEKNGKVVFLDNGDTIHGTFPAVKSKGHSLVPIFY